MTDGEEFIKWFGKFVDQEELDLDVRADTATINLGILEPQTVLDKTITFKGLNLYRGIRLEHAQLVLPPRNNLQALDGFIDLKVLVASMGAIIKSMALSLADGMIEVAATGRECYIKGQRLTLIEHVLNHRSLIIHGSIATVLADLVGGLLMPQLNTGHGTN
ncbi:hypothetical protein MY11210_007406 [Beauveria gryllotalpidicola]